MRQGARRRRRRETVLTDPRVIPGASLAHVHLYHVSGQTDPSRLQVIPSATPRDGFRGHSVKSQTLPWPARPVALPPKARLPTTPQPRPATPPRSRPEGSEVLLLRTPAPSHVYQAGRAPHTRLADLSEPRCLTRGPRFLAAPCKAALLPPHPVRTPHAFLTVPLPQA